MGYEWLGYFLNLALVVLLVGVITFTRLSSRMKLLLVSALLLRVLGSFLRYYLLYAFYDGVGDAARYFQEGGAYAERMAHFDFRMVFDETEWWAGQWWGTQFVKLFSGIVLLIIGPTMKGEFLFFSLLSFLGLVLIGYKASRTTPQLSTYDCFFWILLWPSLWYWPASLGKDALVLLGIGLSVAGYLGDGRKMQWLLLGAGLAFIFAIRPQVAALVVATLMLAQWLSFKEGWTPTRAFQGVVLLISGVVLIWFALNAIGVGGFDTEGVQEYMATKATGGAAGGGSGIEDVGVDWQGAPLALINIWFRPFPWEAHNVLALVSSLEMMLLWGTVWYRRKRVARALRSWRESRFLRFAIPFVLLYSVLLGLSASNLGLIARQRIFIFPFLLALVAWKAPPEKRAAAPGTARQRVSAGAA